jgi:hypothetical protein
MLKLGLPAKMFDLGVPLYMGKGQGKGYGVRVRVRV